MANSILFSKKGNSIYLRTFYNIQFVFAFTLLFSCSNSNNGNLKNKGNSFIRFYYRAQGCENDNCTYYDYLVLGNYENNKFNLKETAEIAHHYLDTAKGNLPIAGVTLIGEEPGEELPSGSFETYYKHYKKQVVSFFFTNDSINGIAIWKEGKAEELEGSMDSLLKSNIKLDNEN
jgi:hypothetical protein